jgi:hypothetical protein
VRGKIKKMKENYVSNFMVYNYLKFCFVRTPYSESRYCSRYNYRLRAGRPKGRSSSPGKIKNFLFSFGLVIRVPGCRSRCPSSIPGATNFPRSSESGTGFTQPREYN